MSSNATGDVASNAKRWVRTARCEDIPLREGRSVRLGGHDVAIFNLGDRFLAIDNRCPHKGGPLSEGIVSGGSVVCPLHTSKVDLETGEAARPGAALGCVGTFRVRVESGILLVELPAASSAKKEMPGICGEHAEQLPVLKRARPQMDDSDAGEIGA